MAAPRLQHITPENYIPWRRKDDVRLAERVRPLSDIQQATENSVVIVGVPDDRGVAANHGRLGSRHGPTAFRQGFYRLPIGALGELEKIELWDAGDLVLQDQIDATHDDVWRVVSALHRRGATVILIGGGQDSSYGSLMGLRDAEASAQLVNIDAHLDLRPREEDGQPGSGSSFRRLVEEGKVSGSDIYLMGFHSHASTASHLQFARAHQIHLWSWDDLTRAGRMKALTDIMHHLSQHRAVGVSWDLDSITGHAAPGVSAPAMLGFSVEETLHLAEMLGAHPSIRQLDLMELNPKVDPQGMTARLAGAIAWHFLAARLRNEE